MISPVIVEAIYTVLRILVEAAKRGRARDAEYIKRVAADAAAWEVEQLALEHARKRRN